MRESFNCIFKRYVWLFRPTTTYSTHSLSYWSSVWGSACLMHADALKKA